MGYFYSFFVLATGTHKISENTTAMYCFNRGKKKSPHLKRIRPLGDSKFLLEPREKQTASGSMSSS